MTTFLDRHQLAAISSFHVAGCESPKRKVNMFALLAAFRSPEKSLHCLHTPISQEDTVKTSQSPEVSESVVKILETNGLFKSVRVLLM